MEKLQFEFTLLPSSDGKSNILCITSIGTPDSKVYAIPEELQGVSHHKTLCSTTSFTKVKNSLKKRYQKRRIWITLSKELSETYLDADNNIQFNDQYLEEISIEKSLTGNTLPTETERLEKIFVRFLENTQTSSNKQQNLKNIAEKFVIEKFTTRNPNASQWIEMFEKECIRCDVTTDESKIEVLRLFLDKSCLDWYNSMIIKLSMNSDWSQWKDKFCHSFINKGWNPVIYALSFKYKEGLLVDYAMRKEKLLLEMRKSIDTDTLIDIIAAGLPEFILNKIDRESLKDTVDLFNELGKYEHLMNRRSRITPRKYENQKYVSKNEEKSPCKICDKLNKGTRYHPEATCWCRSNENGQVKKRDYKHVNNSVIEAELITDQKNEL
ncbi:uncharacterized protein LOC121735693 [Aricia agestis]|uniref:uncharacterized protein LOC121735693 n=1 Tax=Aricia agestis TaxID=91739 RepID=UPI001C20BE52|nr:uncharacterized protein LOC121735693 [Aricia agestis]